LFLYINFSDYQIILFLKGIVLFFVLFIFGFYLNIFIFIWIFIFYFTIFFFFWFQYGCRCNLFIFNMDVVLIYFIFKRHMKTHHLGEKKFCCEVCYKQFGQQGDLKRHSFTHLPHNQRPFYCIQCI
jgi:hypothetical protein